MAFVQILAQLLKDAVLGKRIVPIVADEARTFGMQTLFRQVGIYSALGQLYEPRTTTNCSITRKRRTVRFWKKASTRPVHCPPGSPPPPATARTARRCCRSMLSTRCSGFSASAT